MISVLLETTDSHIGLVLPLTLPTALEDQLRYLLENTLMQDL